MNYYLKINDTPSNIAALNTLNAAGLTSKDPNDYVTTYIQKFWNYDGLTKTIVSSIDNWGIVSVSEFATINNSECFVMVEVPPANYTTHQTVFDGLDGIEVYTDNTSFIEAYPNRKDITITSQVF